MQKEDFTLCKSPLSFNLNFCSDVTRMGSQSDSVGVRTQDPQLRRLLL